MNDNRFLIGGVLGALLVPLLAFVFKLPFLVALIVGAIVFAAIAFVFQPRKLFENLNADAIAAGGVKAAEAILSQAYTDIATVERTAKLITDTSIRDVLQRLAVEARAAAKDVETSPDRLSSVRRLLTYYVPRTGDIAANYAEIAAKTTVSPQQHERMQTALAHLEDTYQHYRQQSVSGESQELDVELDLLDRSIKQDLEKI